MNIIFLNHQKKKKKNYSNKLKTKMLIKIKRMSNIQITLKGSSLLTVLISLLHLHRFG